MHRGKRFNILGVVLALTAILALAVGGSSASAAKTSAAPPNIAQIAKKKGLTKKAVLKLIRSQAEKLRGPAGPPGAPGAVGPQGPPGPSSNTGSPTQTQKFACKTNEGQNDPSCGTIYNSDGLRFQSDCTTNGLSVRTNVANATMTINGVDTEGNFDVVGIAATAINDGFVLTPNAFNSSMGVVTYTPIGSPTVITVNYSATYWPGAPAGDCVFMGTVVKA